MTEQTVTPKVDREELRTLIAEAIDIDAAQVTDDAEFTEELEVDSLMALEMTVQVENRYGIKIDDSEASQFTTLARVHEFIERKLARG